MKRLGGSFMGMTKKFMNCGGTTLVEYALVLLLIAVVVVFAVTMVGDSTNKLYSIVNTEVAQAGS